MTTLDFARTLLLSRIQFATNITFHIIYPSLSIGTAWFLCFFRTAYNRTQNQAWLDNYRLFVKVFALSFAIGVVSGLTMVFQFGTNWPGYMSHVGNIAGPLLGYETLTAFFLEAAFLGIMLFGADRISQRMHTISVFVVAIGATLSAFWILAQNSWMHTPDGYKIVNGIVYPISWFHVIFNPSMIYRFTHMILAATIASAFLILSLSAYRYLKQDRGPDVMLAIKTTLISASILLPLQIIAGDTLGLNTLHYQPAKIAAIEGIWNTTGDHGQALTLFAIPDDAHHKNHFALEVPHLGSVILTHTWNGKIPGLNTYPKDRIPPVFPVFWSFRIMVFLGVLMLIVSWTGSYYLLRKKQIPKMIFRFFVGSMPLGILATVFGWYVSEIGRQPYVIYNLFLTKDFVTTIPPHIVMTTLVLYLITYTLIIAAFFYTIFYMARYARKR